MSAWTVLAVAGLGYLAVVLLIIAFVAGASKASRMDGEE